jgi:hypothetical protein
MADLVMRYRPKALASMPALAIEFDPGGAGWCAMVRNLDPDVVACLGGRVKSLLRVKVAEAGDRDDEVLPDVAGDHEILRGGVRFIPHFPFDPGVPFRVTLALGALGRPGWTEVWSLEFSIPKEMPAVGTDVTQVFPSNDVLPENLLRFYVRFSTPMQRGRAEDNIAVLGPDGAPAPDVLYRAPVELWDRRMTCLTILLDPGRLKRGVGPNRLLGPPLKAGQRYTLAIGPGMIDVYGRPLREGFNKPFSVSEAVRERIAIEEWKIRPPAMENHEPLELSFPRVASPSHRRAVSRSAAASTSAPAKSDGDLPRTHRGVWAPIVSVSRQVLKTYAGTRRAGHSMDRFDRPTRWSSKRPFACFNSR